MHLPVDLGSVAATRGGVVYLPLHLHLNNDVVPAQIVPLHFIELVPFADSFIWAKVSQFVGG